MSVLGICHRLRKLRLDHVQVDAWSQQPDQHELTSLSLIGTTSLAQDEDGLIRFLLANRKLKHLCLDELPLTRSFLTKLSQSLPCAAGAASSRPSVVDRIWFM